MCASVSNVDRRFLNFFRVMKKENAVVTNEVDSQGSEKAFGHSISDPLDSDEESVKTKKEEKNLRIN